MYLSHELSLSANSFGIYPVLRVAAMKPGYLIYFKLHWYLIQHQKPEPFCIIESLNRSGHKKYAFSHHCRLLRFVEVFVLDCNQAKDSSKPSRPSFTPHPPEQINGIIPSLKTRYYAICIGYQIKPQKSMDLSGYSLGFLSVYCSHGSKYLYYLKLWSTLSWGHR